MLTEKDITQELEPSDGPIKALRITTELKLVEQTLLTRDQIASCNHDIIKAARKADIKKILNKIYESPIPTEQKGECEENDCTNPAIVHLCKDCYDRHLGLFK